VSARTTWPTPLAENVERLFEAYVRDADNWGGNPLLGEGGTYKTVLGYKEDRGLLTQLKRAGLVTTFNSDGCQFLAFTAAGAAKARLDYGVELPGYAYIDKVQQ